MPQQPQPASVLLNRLLARARFRHVQVFVRLAELGSVRRTAEDLGMTQPGITQILRDLEELLGTPLFHRHARGVRPTPAGIDLLPLARQLLLGLASTAEAAAQRHGPGQGLVRVVASTAAMNGLLVRALPEFNDAHPAVQVHLREAEIDDILLAIARGQADLACGRRMAVVPEGWVFHALVPDHFAVVCAPDHPLARKRVVTLADLEQQEWLPAPAGSIARDHFDALCRRFAAEPTVCNVVTRVPSATWALLRHRPMLTVVPYGVARYFLALGEIAMLRLKESVPLEPIGMLLPVQDAGPATVRLGEFLAQCAKRKGSDGRR